MIIEDTEKLQAWLAKVLKPLCDADPLALAKYVLALIKKDKSEAELRQNMVHQLDVFLESETTSFVDKLCIAMNTREYMSADSPTSSTALPSTSVSCGGSTASVEDTTLSIEKPVTSLSSTSEFEDIMSTSSGPDSSSVQEKSTSPSLLAELKVDVSSQTNSPESVSNTILVTSSTPLISETAEMGSASVSATKEDADSTSCSSSPSSRQRDPCNDESNKNRRKVHTGKGRRSRSRSADRGLLPVKRPANPRLDGSHDRHRRRSELPARYRNERKSSPPRRFYRGHRDIVRSKSPLASRKRSSSPKNRSRNRSPPPFRYRRLFNRSQSRSISPIIDRSRSPRYISRSPDVDKDCSSKDSSEKDPSFNKPFELDSNTEVNEKKPLVQSVVVVPCGTERPSADDDSQHSLGVSTIRISNNNNNRCRDFDEKGLCMRGELCPFDHGKDPVVLVPGMTPGGYSGSRDMVPPPITTNFSTPLVRHPMVAEYYPDSPSFEPPSGWSPATPPFRPRRMGFDGMVARGGRGRCFVRPSYVGQFPAPGTQRGLFNVPVSGSCTAPGIPMMGARAHVPPGMNPMPLYNCIRKFGIRGGGYRGGRGGGFNFARLGVRLSPHHQHSHTSYTNCSLEVRKIPPVLNTIDTLNSHFVRFGKIINIQVNFDNDPEAAIVTFSSPTEAQLAYRSAEAVLNNRFIRVFWHNNEKENEQVSEAAVVTPKANMQDHNNSVRTAATERLGAGTQEDGHMEQERIIFSGNESKPFSNNEFTRNLEPTDTSQTMKLGKPRHSAPAPEGLSAQMTLNILQQQRKAEALKMSNDLRRRQQTMMEEQIGQQKRLLAKLENGSLSAREKEEIVKLLKIIQESVTKLRKDLSDSSPPKVHHHITTKKNPVEPKVVINSSQVLMAKNTPRTKEEAQKEMLDAELDLINREQLGEDTFDLQKKVLDLKKSLGFTGQSTRGRGRSARGIERGFARPRGMIQSRQSRGRGGIRTLCSVDRRPTKIRITGFPADRIADILAHFWIFGPIRDCISDSTIPMMIIDFNSRKSAEVAMANGHVFEKTNLNIEWDTDVTGTDAGPVKNNTNVSNDELYTSEISDEEENNCGASPSP